MKIKNFPIQKGSILLGAACLLLWARPAWSQDSDKPEVDTKDEVSSATPAPAKDSDAAGKYVGDGNSAAKPSPAGRDANGLLRLNFRNAPLELVLNYLSEAAGYIIVLETDVRGKIDVWSNQPVTREEAMSVLDSALTKNGYAAIRNGRTLTIVTKDSAKRREIPVRSGSDPEQMPKSDEIVTQIIPIRYINAAQLTQNLSSLLPTGAELTANEAGNALIMTGTQAGIRHITEIIRALDTSTVGATTIKVYTLRYADAKQLATLVKELFPTTGTGAGGTGGGTGGGFPGFGGRGGGTGGTGGFGGFGGFPGFGGGQGGGTAGRGTGATGGNTRASASRVNAVADEHSNSLVVNAPDDVLPSIDDLVRRVDKDVEDITELRTFRLKYSDPVEMADLLTSLFPDETQSSTTGGGGSAIRFGGFGGFGGAGGRTGSSANAESALSKKRGKVVAVPDQRTSTVVVKAARDLMTQIAQMVEQLDSNPAKKQKVYVYDLENADPTEVENVLRSLFENQQNQTRNTQRNNQQQNSALNTRANQQQQQNGQRTGNTGFGGQGAAQGLGR